MFFGFTVITGLMTATAELQAGQKVKNINDSVLNVDQKLSFFDFTTCTNGFTTNRTVLIFSVGCLLNLIVYLYNKLSNRCNEHLLVSHKYN